jgi:rubrerythrin
MVTKLSDLEISEVSLVDVPANNKKIIFKNLQNGDKMNVKKMGIMPSSPVSLTKHVDKDGLEEAGLPKKQHPAVIAATESATEHRNAADEAMRTAEIAERAAEAAESVAEAAERAIEEIGEDAEEAEEDEEEEEEEFGEEEPELKEGREVSPEPGTPAPELPVGENPERDEEKKELPPTEGDAPKEDIPAEGEKVPEHKDAHFCSECGHPMEDGKCPECAKKDCVGKAKNKNNKKSAKKTVPKSDVKPDTKSDVNKAAVDLQKALTKIAELEKTATDAKSALIQKEFVEKAQKEFGHVPGVSSEQLGIVLKNASDKMDATHYKTLQTILKATEAMLAQSVLTQTVGVKAESRMSDGSAAGRLDTKAREIMSTVSKNKGENITYERAFVIALQQNPKIYEEYLHGN